MAGKPRAVKAAKSVKVGKKAAPRVARPMSPAAVAGMMAGDMKSMPKGMAKMPPQLRTAAMRKMAGSKQAPRKRGK